MTIIGIVSQMICQLNEFDVPELVSFGTQITWIDVVTQMICTSN